ncbi:Toll/interleukin-1 receptor homology (TIR) domain-containing protein [Hirschfeldia incana]|nr:Toll/interleukin-1 receptor homology (TIR) domain-containing protein [Hirschfeldia incana]
MWNWSVNIASFLPTVYPKGSSNFPMADSSSSTCGSMVKQLSPRVFVNFRGDELRDNFISHLETALRDGGVHYFLDNLLDAGTDLKILFNEIEDSEIALAVFSKRYSESKWCLNELVKIMEKVEENKLHVIPIFFKVKVDDVKKQIGDFQRNLLGGGPGERPEIPIWEKALHSVTAKLGLHSAKYKNESEFIVNIILEVKKKVELISSARGGERSNNMLLSPSISSVSSIRSITCRTTEQPHKDLPLYGIDQRLDQLKGKLFGFKCAESRIVGIVGMPGIGKTSLATAYCNKFNHKFFYHKNILSIRENSIKRGKNWLKSTLLDGQDFNEEADMFRKKILYVLDDVSHKDHVKFLYTGRKWIRGGSKIIITTRDKSLIQELVDDIYLVPCLNDKEALQLFNSHAFDDQTSSSPTGNFTNLSKCFVEYAEGNPRALEELGKEVYGREEAHWEERLATLPHCCNQNILNDLRSSYDELTCQQKDAFLDIACFFRSEEEEYVKSLLDESESGEAVRDLTEKYFICISAGRIEMHNLLCTLGKELGSSYKNSSGGRMWDHDKIIKTLRSVEEGTKKVRGIFLDTCKLSKGIPLDTNTFFEKFDQSSLRYLKIYDSLCPQQCESDGKVNLPDELKLPFQEIQYLHWLKFPSDELPSDFNPNNLIDLRLPYSKIERVWKTPKKAPRLKWVDLSYSTMLSDLSALSKAIDLQRINLEGCTNLSELPREMKNMKSLVFINLKGCIQLSSLPAKMNLISLKTLILSGCSKFNKFELNSENLEFLHLDGTAIKSLPTTIQYFKKLVILNLKGCKMLESLPPYCLDKLKALEELILSGCAELKRFPDIKENMENLQILLLDGTSIKEVPNILLQSGKCKDQVVCQQPLRMNSVSLLRRLCLSGNEKILSLGSSISQLYHLKWIDLKGCKKLESISTLPPNLQCLDAHDCVSLKAVANPLALLIPTTQQVPSSFIFTNCEKLDHVANNEIICCAHNKSRLLSEALNRHSQGFASEALVATSFPGSEIPAWFSHMASGSELEPELPRHWSEQGFVGIALSAVISFEDLKNRYNKLQVKCKCVFNNNETSPSNFDCRIGGLSETGDEERTFKSTHVFIGYTNWLNIKKFQEGDCMMGCVPTKASVKFEVIDGTKEVRSCEIIKCGFSLVYESGSWEASSRRENVSEGESVLLSLWRGINWFFKPLNYIATAKRDDTAKTSSSKQLHRVLN